MWGGLEDGERSKFEALAKEDQERYRRQISG